MLLFDYEDMEIEEQGLVTNDVWDALADLTSWPDRVGERHSMERKEMKRVEKVREDFIQSKRHDYRCNICKGKLEVVEFAYGNVTVVKVQSCEVCNTTLRIKEYKEGYDKGYERGQEDR